MPKLVVATDSFLPRIDGIARYLADMLPQLPFQIEVIAPNNEGKLKKSLGKHIKIHKIPLTKTKFGDYKVPKTPSHKYKKIIQDADIVWVHTLGPIGHFAAKVAAKHGNKLVSSVHSIEWELVPRSLSKFNALKYIASHLALWRAKKHYGMADIILIPDPHTYQLFSAKHIGHTLRYVKLGIDIDKFCPAKDKQAAKEKIGIEPFRKVVGYVGRLSREKGVETLIQAFSRINEKQNAVLLVVGDGIAELKEQLAQKNIIYVGPKEDVVPYLQAMDVFVMPSYTETTCLATLEAMACGIVPVVTPVGAMKTYVVDKQNGLHFPVGNAFVLALKLNWVLEDAKRIQAMGKKAQNAVTDEYDWQNTVKTTVKELQNCLTKASSSSSEDD